MTSTAKYPHAHRTNSPGESNSPILERFAQLVTERVEALAAGPDRGRIVKLAKQAVREARASLDQLSPAATGPATLPVSRLKASEVISQGMVDLSQATLYRAAEAGRFYCTTPKGRSIGKEFPAWQFVEPAPELIPAILTILATQPNSEIHAFWVTALDSLNELSPAEVLVGKPFETRANLHHSQQAILALPSGARVHKVRAIAAHQLRSMADVIG